MEGMPLSYVMLKQSCCAVDFVGCSVEDAHMMPNVMAKYRKEAIVVPKVMMKTLVVPLARTEKASFFRQFAHSKSKKCQQASPTLSNRNASYLTSSRMAAACTCQSSVDYTETSSQALELH
jgi:hypothetical protein